MFRPLVALVLIVGLAAGAADASARTAAPRKVRLVSTPPAMTQATTAHFLVVAPRGTRLRCRLDVRTPWRCGRRVRIEGLKPGLHRLTVRGTWRGRRLTTATFAWHVVVPPGRPVVVGTAPASPDDLVPITDGRPVPTALPSIAGRAVAGQFLTASAGTWTGATQVTRRWQRCNAAGAACVTIPGQTSLQHYVAEQDAGRTLRVVETATNAAGAVEAASPPTAVVPSPPTSPGPPTISGADKQVGTTLTADPGVWSGAGVTLTYQWLRCAYDVGAGGACLNIDGATGLTYVLADADQTTFVVFVVTADSPSGSTAKASAAYGPIDAP